MELKDIIEIVLLVGLGGLSIYYNYNAKLKANVEALIDKAEETYADTTNAGGEKFSFVVDKLFLLLPAPFRMIIPRSMVEEIVQNSFDSIERYAVKQLDKVFNKEKSEE